MATNEVSMNVPVVRDMAKQFSDINDVLTTVCKTLDILINTLKATAFIGLVGGLAVANFLETIKPYIEQVAEKCSKLSQAVKASVDAYEQGDLEGANQFMTGLQL